jgi:hypothetical protein
MEHNSDNHGSRIILIMILILLPAVKLFPHRDDFLDETVVYLTLARQELELEYWFDYGSLTGIDFIRHNFASEYGITNHWMIDGRITIDSPDISGFNFQSGRFETRYRFYEEGTLPVDIALSAEINSEKSITGEKETGAEGRLILSHDFADRLNLTLNIAEEIAFDSGQGAFFPSFGFRYDANDLFRLGSEIKYNTYENSGSVIPQLWLTFGESITLKFGYSQGLGNKNENFGRVALEAEI